jgi:hypothetical protein
MPRKERRVSVPVADDDLAYLQQLQHETRLSLAALVRLLFQRGMRAYQRDQKLSEGGLARVGKRR